MNLKYLYAISPFIANIWKYFAFLLHSLCQFLFNLWITPRQSRSPVIFDYINNMSLFHKLLIFWSTFLRNANILISLHEAFFNPTNISTALPPPTIILPLINSSSLMIYPRPFKSHNLAPHSLFKYKIITISEWRLWEAPLTS